MTGYPTKALTDYDFYLKMTFITLGVFTMFKIYERVFSDANLSDADMVAKGKNLAKFSLAFWIAAIWAGRMLSETYTYITYGHKYAR